MTDQVGDTPEVVEEVAEKTMDDTIRETLAEIESRGKEPEEVTEDPPEEPETDEQKADRVRDDKGRFAPKVATEEPAPEVEEPPSAITAPVAAPISPELQRLGLRKEEADEIAKSPVAMQAIIRRSEEMHKGLEQYREKAQFGTNMEAAITPFMPTIRALGVSPEVAINKMLSVDNVLRYGTPQQKTATFSQLARDYGVDLGQAQEFNANQPQVDPQVQQLQSELHQMKGWIEQQNQARDWNERQSLNSTIESFAKDPSHIHFEAVRADMAGILQAGLATDLNDAYEKAIYANPTTRAQLLAAQQAKADETRKLEATQKAQAAKKAASVNVPRKGVMPAARPIGTMEETIRAEAERLGMF